jgi:AcrR family transcriptional regulator
VVTETDPRSSAKRPRRTQAERRAEAGQKLMAAALKLIAEKGASRTSLAEIGEAAGYSRALPAVYFRDKESLVRAVWDYVSSLFQRKMEIAGARRPGLDAVLGFVEVYLTRSGTDAVIFRAAQVLQTEALGATSEIRQSVATHNRNSETFLRKHIRIGVERGEIRGDVDPRAQAVLIMGALRGALSHSLIDPGVDLGAVRREFLRSLGRSLAP